MVSKFSEKVQRDQDNFSLRKYLKLKLDCNQKEVQNIIESGVVFIDKRKETFGSKKVRSGQIVHFSISTQHHKTIHRHKVDPKSIKILWENDDLLAVNKLPGIPSQRTKDPKRFSMEHWAKDHYQGSLYLTHRLDRDTSGVLLFAKTKAMEKECFDWFKHRKVQKVYHAISYGKSKHFKSETWIHHLKAAPPRGGRSCFKAVHSGGLRAETEVKLLSTNKDHCFWELKPHTGRTHQLRVQLSEQHFPIVGDDLYDRQHRNRPPAPHHLLHARELHLPSWKNETKSISAEYPETWNPYLKDLS